MNNYKYSQTWFLDSEIKKLLLNFMDKTKKNNILEIGCFEGLSSVFFADNLLENTNSTLTCVDPFLNIDNNDHKQFLNNNEENNFDYNISICKNSDKVSINKISSDVFFENNKKTYNLIYIDGCHECNVIMRDMENSFNVLESNGIMWMDDYCGGDNGQIKKTMNIFLEKYKEQYDIIHIGYQLTIKKKSLKKIIDCFIFYNELELLTYRLNILNNVVDYFIIVEATHTFSGKDKKLFYNENKSLFKKFNDKIIHIIVNNFPFIYPNINFNNNEQWANEHHQRNSISHGLNYINNLNDIDLIIISDVDEIPDPNTLYNIKNSNIEIDVNSLEMELYYYNLNTKYHDLWNLSKIISYKKYKELNIPCQNIRNMQCLRIKNGGWHLSYFGDSVFIKNKINAFSHQELNNDNFTDLLKIDERVKNNSDLYDRVTNIHKISINDNIYLPLEYNTYLTNFYDPIV